MSAQGRGPSAGSSHRTRWADERHRGPTRVLGLCTGGGARVHAGFEDPAAVMGSEAVWLEAFRRIGDEIEAWAAGFVRDELGSSGTSWGVPGAD